MEKISCFRGTPEVSLEPLGFGVVVSPRGWALVFGGIDYFGGQALGLWIRVLSKHRGDFP